MSHPAVLKPIVTMGETMGLFRAATSDEFTDSSAFHLGLGGAESNVAIGLARLGIPCRWLGRVGNDPIGRRIAQELAAQGVDAIAILDDVAATGVMIKEQTRSNERPVVYYRTGSAGSRLSIDDLPAAEISEAALLHITGITLALSDSARDTVFAAIREARSAGVPVSFDVNHRPALWVGRDPSPVYREVAELADIVFAGDDEARILVPGATTPQELARALSDLGPRQAIVKLGADGCVAEIDGSALSQAAMAIDPVDTVGAGDAFVAGYLAEFVRGLPPASRLRTASASGAFACLHLGDWEGFPTRAEVDSFGD